MKNLGLVELGMCVLVGCGSSPLASDSGGPGAAGAGNPGAAGSQGSAGNAGSGHVTSMCNAARATALGAADTVSTGNVRVLSTKAGVTT